MKRFFEQHPNIHVDFHLSHHLLTKLLNDELDMAIDCRPHIHPEIQVIPLFREEYVVIASPEYIAANDIHDLGDIEHCNILSLDKSLDWWGNFIHALPAERQACFRRVTVINHIRGIINAALCGIGIGFVPKYTVLNAIAEGALTILFPDRDILNDRINIYIKEKRAALDKNICLMDFLKRLQLQ